MQAPAFCLVSSVSLPRLEPTIWLPLFSSCLDAHIDMLLERKDSVASMCLQRVESTVDSFLVHFYGFDHDAIPFDYLDQAPPSLAKVESNLGILIHCLSDLFLPGSVLQSRLIHDLRRELYEGCIDPLLTSLENAVKYSQCDMKGQKLEKANLTILHLNRMKSMEEHFLDEKYSSKGLSDVVPISGLVASRLHRLENEARTVLSHWGRR